MNSHRTRKLRTDDWLSAREARELVFFFIRWGDHFEDYLRDLPDSTVEADLHVRGYNLTAVISELQQNPHRAIAWFENILEGGTSEISVPSGGQVKHSFIVDGVTISEQDVHGHAMFRQAHKADFTMACQARNRAIIESSIDSFYTAISKGFSSLEAYVTLRVAVHNSKCSPEDRLEEKKTKGGFVTFETKIREWLPKLTGVSIDFGKSPCWNDFLYLKQLRNDVVIHPKPGAGLTTLDELAEGINRFRYGIGSLMFVLHQAFRQPMQGSIIRAMRYPEVRVVMNDLISHEVRQA